MDHAVAVDLQTLVPAPHIGTVGDLVSVIVKNAFVMAGVISFMLLILGGFGIIVAAGDAKKLEQSRGTMMGAVTGLIMIVGSFWIIRIIEKVTGLSILTPGI